MLSTLPTAIEVAWYGYRRRSCLREVLAGVARQGVLLIAVAHDDVERVAVDVGEQDDLRPMRSRRL
jgi:hypothetical protein